MTGEAAFRRYAGTQLVSMVGTWVHQTALPWLVLEQWGSPTLMGVVVALQFAPMLLGGAYAGLVVDRYPRKQVLLATQIAPLLLSGLLAGFVLAGAHGPLFLAVVLVVALGFGLVVAVDEPARNAVLLDLAGREGLRTKVVASPLMVDLSRAAGPALAAVLIESGGLGFCFLVNAVSYVPVALVLARLPLPPSSISPEERRRAAQVREGLRYVARHRSLAVPMVMIVLTGTLTYEFFVTLPIVAKGIFAGSSMTLGGLYALFSAGSVLAWLTRGRWTGGPPSRFAVAGLVFGAAVALLALSWSLSVALVFVVLVGAASVMFLSLGIAQLQLNADRAYLGRVMALWGMGYAGTTAVGGPVVGWVAQEFGGRAALLTGAAAAVAAGLYGLARLPSRAGTEEALIAADREESR